MELPGGLAAIDPPSPGTVPGSNAELTAFLIVGQAMVGRRGFCAKTRPEPEGAI
jgi:hypothetical protein